MANVPHGKLSGVETNRINRMATTYNGINYFPINVNFTEESALEVIEAKYGIKGSGIVLKLMCKIYKEGYYISWSDEQCMIFASKAGRDVATEEVSDIISILLDKEMLYRKSYEENGILTSPAIQRVWLEATKRRKKDWKALPYLLVETKNAVQDANKNEENADIFRQSKVKQRKELPLSVPPEGTEDGLKEVSSLSSPPSPPGYAFNTRTHNYTGLMESLERLGVRDDGEIKAILSLSDYGRKGTAVWKLLSETNWSRIAAKGKYMITVLRKT